MRIVSRILAALLLVSSASAWAQSGVPLSAMAPTRSDQLHSVITDPSGNGQVVFNISPSLVTPDLGTPSAADLANATGLPLSTGVTGMLAAAHGGTGVNNGTSTITLGGSLTFSGPYSFGATLTANTSVTFPASGLLATLTGSPTAGNLAVMTSNGVTDAGVQLLTTLPQESVWGNNASTSGPPSALSVLTLGNGSCSAPTYSFNASPTTGIASGGTGYLDLCAGGNLMARLRAGSTNYFELLASSTPMIRAQGGANSALQVMANGTGSLDLGSNGGGTNQYIARFFPSGTAGSSANYLTFTGGILGSGVTIGALSSSTDTNIDITITPPGTGKFVVSKQIKYSGTNTTGSGSAALGSNSPAVTNTAPYTWFQVTTSDGSTGYVPVWK